MRRVCNCSHHGSVVLFRVPWHRIVWCLCEERKKRVAETPTSSSKTKSFSPFRDNRDKN